MTDDDDLVQTFDCPRDDCDGTMIVQYERQTERFDQKDEEFIRPIKGVCTTKGCGDYMQHEYPPYPG